MLPPQYEREESALAEEETRLKKPQLFKVILHNDDYTTMDFVVYVLQSVFNRPEGEALQVMLQVHMQGSGVAGIYTFEVAEMKVSRVMSMARSSEFPLLCTVEPSQDDA